MIQNNESWAGNINGMIDHSNKLNLLYKTTLMINDTPYYYIGQTNNKRGIRGRWKQHHQNGGSPDKLTLLDMIAQITPAKKWTIQSISLDLLKSENTEHNKTLLDCLERTLITKLFLSTDRSQILNTSIPFGNTAKIEKLQLVNDNIYQEFRQDISSSCINQDLKKQLTNATFLFSKTIEDLDTTRELLNNHIDYNINFNKINLCLNLVRVKRIIRNSDICPDDYTNLVDKKFSKKYKEDPNLKKFILGS